MDKVIKNFQNITYGPAPEDSKEVTNWIKNLHYASDFDIIYFLLNIFIHLL